jgi:hypothetical protein
VLFLLAQEGGGGGVPDWTQFVQYGVLGLVVLAFIFGKIVPGYLYDKRVQEHQQEKEETKRLEETIRDRIIPALVQSTDVMAQVLDMLNEFEQPDRRPASSLRERGRLRP